MFFSSWFKTETGFAKTNKCFTRIHVGLNFLAWFVSYFAYELNFVCVRKHEWSLYKCLTPWSVCRNELSEPPTCTLFMFVRFSHSSDLLDVTFHNIYFQIRHLCNCTYRMFPFDDYPSHVRILKGAAWKPIVIQVT